MRAHEVVDVATSDGPPMGLTVDQIVDSGRRLQRRRGAGWTAGGAALAVAAVALAATLVMPGPGPRTGNGALPAASVGATRSRTAVPTAFSFPADPFTYAFSAFDAGKLHVQKPI